jgi:D-aminoacyl-tRNA deacylase
MRAVIQRVSKASVLVKGKEVGAIQQGLLVLLGVAKDDTQQDLDWLCKKIVQMRIFADEEGKMNKDIQQVDYDILCISQFTLLASTQKGNRPSYIDAAAPEVANLWYEKCLQQLSELLGKKVEKGIFGADMQVSLVNDGPVTITIDTKNKQ